VLLFLARCASGVCVALDARTYRCDCAEGYRGALCDQQGAPEGSCQRGAPCLRGRCQQAEDGEERCVCEPGFTGESCDIGEGRPANHPVAPPLKRPLIVCVTLYNHHVLNDDIMLYRRRLED